MSVVSNNTFLYLLADAGGRSYEITNGIVEKNNNPTWLKHAPSGWQQNGVTFARNSTYYGLNRSFTGNLKFVSDGAQIIRNLFYSQKGVEQELYLLVLKWNNLTDVYELNYRAQLDLSTFQDNVFNGVEVALIDGGVAKLLKANESTVYEFPLDGSIPENKRLNIDGREFLDKFLFETVQYSGINGSAALPITFLSNSGDNIGIEKGSQVYETFSDFASYVSSSNNFMFSSVADTVVTITGKFSITCNIRLAGVPTELFFGTGVGTGVTFFNGLINPGETKVFDFDASPLTLNVLANQKVFLVIEGSVFNTFTLNSVQLSFQFATRFQATQCWAIACNDLFRMLVDKMTTSKYNCFSSLLDSKANLMLTSGDALRAWSYVASPGNPLPQIVLKTSFKDFWTSFDSILCASVGNVFLNGTEQLFFEKRGFVYDSSTIDMNLGEVSNLNLNLAPDYYFNAIKEGYEEQNYDQQSGKQEYNTTYQYKINSILPNKELPFVSKYRADSMGIEFTRFNSTQGASITNNSSDNTVFILNVDTAGNALHFTASDSIAQDCTTPLDINFDTLINAISTQMEQTTLSTYTYRGTNPKIVTITAQAQRTGGTGIATITILINGVSIGSVPDNNVQASYSITLNPGDTIKLHSVYSGIGTPQITSASFDIGFSSISIYSLKRVTYDAISGVDNPSSNYNIEELTPKRMFLNWGPWIRSVHFNRVNDLFTYQTSSKNPLLSTTLNGVTIREAGNVLVGALEQPLFYPYILSFKTTVPVNTISLFTDAANGHIQCSYNGKQIYGFPVEIKQIPYLNEAQEWKLLLSTKTNLQDLIDLDIDGINFLNLTGMPLYISHLSPVKVVPLGQTLPAQYHYRDMDNWWFSEQIQFYVSRKNYFQKWQQNDIIQLQCLTNGLGPVKVDVLDTTGKIVKTITELTQINDPAVKVPNILYQGALALNDLAEGVYYLLFTAGVGTVAQGISEGLHIKADWPLTQLFEYSNSKNKQATIFTSGYAPNIRVEGWMDSFTPDANVAAYEDQPADMVIIDGIPFRKHTLHLGNEVSLVPPWIIDKLNRIFLLDNVKREGLQITRNGQDSKFEMDDIPGIATKLWTMEVREADNASGIAIPSTTGGVLDDNLTVVYNINTKAFGDGSNGDNIVEVTKVE